MGRRRGKFVILKDLTLKIQALPLTQRGGFLSGKGRLSKKKKGVTTKVLLEGHRVRRIPISRTNLKFLRVFLQNKKRRTRRKMSKLAPPPIKGDNSAKKA